MYKQIIIDGIATVYKVNENGDVIGKFGKKLKPNTVTKGYQMVKLYMDNGKKRNASVHRLVAEAFIPNPDNKPEVNHNDGNKKNNHVDNLEWVTGSENVKHAFDHKLRILKYGDENHVSKFSDELIHSICKLYTEGYTSRKIRKKLHIENDYIINCVLTGKTRTSISSLYGIIPYKDRKNNKSNNSSTTIENTNDGYYHIHINV